jgi:hypothetical protein
MATGNNWDFEEDENAETPEGSEQQPKSKGGGLRAHAEQVKRENDELKAEVEKFKSAERTRNLETAIKAKGFDPKVADLVPKDVSSEAAELDKWLTERAGLFKASGVNEDEQVTEMEANEDELNDDVDAWGRVSRVASSALPPTKQADTMAAIRNAQTREELNEVLRKHGNSNI